MSEFPSRTEGRAISCGHFRQRPWQHTGLELTLVELEHLARAIGIGDDPPAVRLSVPEPAAGLFAIRKFDGAWPFELAIMHLADDVHAIWRVDIPRPLQQTGLVTRMRRESTCRREREVAIELAVIPPSFGAIAVLVDDDAGTRRLPLREMPGIDLAPGGRQHAVAVIQARTPVTHIRGAVGQLSAPLSVQIAVHPFPITQGTVDILERAMTVTFAVSPLAVIAAAIREVEAPLSLTFALLPGAAVSVSIRIGDRAQTFGMTMNEPSAVVRLRCVDFRSG